MAIRATYEQHVTEALLHVLPVHKIKFGSQTGYFGAFRKRQQAVRYTFHIHIIIIIVKEGYLLTISGQRTGHWTETRLVSATSKLHSLSYYDRQSQTRCTSSTHHQVTHVTCPAPDSWQQPCTSTSFLLASSLQTE